VYRLAPTAQPPKNSGAVLQSCTLQRMCARLLASMGLGSGKTTCEGFVEGRLDIAGNGVRSRAWRDTRAAHSFSLCRGCRPGRVLNKRKQIQGSATKSDDRTRDFICALAIRALWRLQSEVASSRLLGPDRALQIAEASVRGCRHWGDAVHRVEQRARVVAIFCDALGCAGLADVLAAISISG